MWWWSDGFTLVGILLDFGMLIDLINYIIEIPHEPISVFLYLFDHPFYSMYH